jgi:microcystin-dependent protein
MINIRQDFDQTFTDYNHIIQSYTISTSANFPFNSTSKTRYVIELDECIYVDDTHLFSIAGYALSTAKAPTSSNTYYITPIQSISQITPVFPYLVEFPPANAGETISIDYYGIGSPITVTSFNTLNNPIGDIHMFGGAAAPSGWLICDGSAVSRATYGGLFTIIGTVFGIGDGVNTFNLPDMRAATPAGVGTSTGFTANETVALGVKSNDQMQGHLHPLVIWRNITGGSGSIRADTVETNSATVYTASPYTDGVNGTPRTGNVTKGKTIGVNFIIKY